MSGKDSIAIIMRGDTHDSPRANVGKHIFRKVQWHLDIQSYDKIDAYIYTSDDDRKKGIVGGGLWDGPRSTSFFV